MWPKFFFLLLFIVFFWDLESSSQWAEGHSYAL